MSKIYTTIDSILDTRHALLYYLDNELAIKCLEDNSYKTRVKDNFGNISFDIFNSLYRKRNKALLNLATPTNICKIIADLFIENLIDPSNDGEHILYVNLYPYKLSLDEQNNLLDMFKYLLPDFVGVTLINLNKEELEPSWCNDNLEFMVMYDAMEWIEYNTSNYKLILNPILDIEMLAPSISNGRVKNTEINNELFKTLATNLGSFVKYLPIDIKHFNTIIGNEKK